MKTNMSPKSKREYLFRLGYVLFGIALPDQSQKHAQYSMRHGLFRIGLALMFAVACASVISSLGDFVSGFIEGFTEGSGATPKSCDKFETCGISRQLLLSLLAIAWFLTHNYLLKHAIAQTIARHDAEREHANQLEIASTLRLLKAQIEPHFLFNTLGLVQHLAEPTAPQAAACATCDAYLKIMQARLPRRLSYEVDCPPELLQFRLPSALLLTLVENAIKHGIEPSIEGGHVQIAAKRSDEQVIITVSDTGVGFGKHIGHGLGLDHIRNRLALMYGDKAKLELEENETRGVIARLIFPV